MTDQSEISRKRRPDARPSEILDAALDLFSERGFAATRLEDVASRAGLSKAAIYLYFRDKTSLLQALVQAQVGPNLEMAHAMAASHQGPVEPLLRQILGFLAHRVATTRLPNIIKLIISESRAHPELGRWYLANVVGKVLPLLQSLIERGIASGEFRPVDARLAVKSLVAPALMSALWKTTFQPLGADALDPVALLAQHADIVLRGLKP